MIWQYFASRGKGGMRELVSCLARYRDKNGNCPMDERNSFTRCDDERSRGHDVEIFGGEGGV